MKIRLERDPQQTTQRVYSNPSESDRSFIGETDSPLAVRLREHRDNLKEGLTETSNVAQLAYEEGHLRWCQDFGNLKQQQI
jgi:hypothetical protein